MEVPMFAESFMLPRNRALDRKWADEAGEEIGTGGKLLAVLLSLGLAGVVTIAIPFALLHLR
jgi:hypothetical protein